MVKKQEIHDTTLISTPLENIMSDRFSRYSKYIIKERALPDARDGLKPVQRRILYAMFHEGNTYDHAFRKSAKTVGLVIGNYHPHGDTSVYDAMVRMSQEWKINHPLIEMHGNNGSIDDDPAAAMRYTEARLSKIASTMEVDLDKDTVEFAPNFDDTENEPTVLPARFPTLLVNGATGIAAGYATNIAPHNLSEVIKATIYRIQNPQCSLEEIMQIMPGPDFPTGAIVQGKKGILEAFKTGKGRIVVRSKAEIVQTKTIQQIIITEIPYEVIKSNMVKKMDAGNIISQQEIAIGDKETTGQLYDRLSVAGAKLLLETLPDIIAGTNQSIVQDESLVTYAPTISREEEKLDFNLSAKQVYNKVRGLNPWPGAFTTYQGKNVKIWAGDIHDCPNAKKHHEHQENGTIVKIFKDAIGVKTGDGIYLITELQIAGKKRMLVKDYLNGNNIFAVDSKFE